MKLNKENIVLSSMLIGALILFIIICALIYKSGDSINLDFAIRDFMYDIRGEKCGFTYWFYRIITKFGHIYFAVVLVIFAAIYTKFDNRFFFLIISIVLSTLINQALKQVFSRERPNELFQWMNESSKSFPSGHSNNATVCFFNLIYWLFKSNCNKKFKITGYIVSGLILVFVMISRLVLGVHYFTDVLAGFSMGVVVSSASMLLLNYYDSRNIHIVKILINKEKEEINE